MQFGDMFDKMSWQKKKKNLITKIGEIVCHGWQVNQLFQHRKQNLMKKGVIGGRSSHGTSD